VSQHPRPYFNGQLTVMGYTLRSQEHRYVEWRSVASGEIVAQELYESATSGAEVRNVIDDPLTHSARRRLEAAAQRLAPPLPQAAL
jgi:hypothetical protein